MEVCTVAVAVEAGASPVVVAAAFPGGLAAAFRVVAEAFRVDFRGDIPVPARVDLPGMHGLG